VRCEQLGILDKPHDQVNDDEPPTSPATDTIVSSTSTSRPLSDGGPLYFARDDSFGSPGLPGAIVSLARRTTGTPGQDCLIRAQALDTERRYRMTVAPRSTWRTERRISQNECHAVHRTAEAHGQGPCHASLKRQVGGSWPVLKALELRDSHLSTVMLYLGRRPPENGR
jgi:hypothetical protein